ncbi:hypothetical protein Ae717Ps2_6065c [Pseudonocardia sp. Ae717_Ps2]|nr:hypothetical protein Ae717Ps2_6065c [Pseudonocardia sp. Ae717_Ps2]
MENDVGKALLQRIDLPVLPNGHRRRKPSDHGRSPPPGGALQPAAPPPGASTPALARSSASARSRSRSSCRARTSAAVSAGGSGLNRLPGTGLPASAQLVHPLRHRGALVVEHDRVAVLVETGQRLV